MPELIEQMYCSQQIVIPPKFPYILKRYCKAAIKTQPYDLLRWSFEYFKALAERRAPPVKLRLEYPVYSTEGGLTRGCLKVLANQLSGMTQLPLQVAKAAWRGFCLDPEELRRIFCLCEVFMRSESVPFLHFIAVAGGMLTKNLTHTMILLCETLTKEPDGGSAGISVHDFLIMYRFLANMDASSDMRYINGYREGFAPPVEEEVPEEESFHQDFHTDDESVDVDFWLDSSENLQKVALINDHVARSARISMKSTQPIIGKLQRSPSAERAADIERQNYMMESKEAPLQSDEVNQKLRQMSNALLKSQADILAEEGLPEERRREEEEPIPEENDEIKALVDIHVFDEDDQEVFNIEFYGQPVEVPKKVVDDSEEQGFGQEGDDLSVTEDGETKKSEVTVLTEEQKIMNYVENSYQERKERRANLQKTFNELNAIVDRFHSANYDLGMVAGRQMSTTSGEFIVQHIEKEILDYIDDQIAILPDPDLKKKKAKPEEVAMIRTILETFLDENMDIIVPEVEEVEEEEEPIPEIIIVYAVPGIGKQVDEETIRDFEEYALEACKVQAEIFMPRNIRHFMCPPLERYAEYQYEESIKEEVPTSGVFTD